MSAESSEENSFEFLFPKKRRRWPWLLLAFVIVAAIGSWMWISDWKAQQPISASGGLYFPWRVELNVPQYFQGDATWKEDPLGPTEGTLGQEGCAVSSAAMVLAFYGIDTDPGRLNAFLKTNGGYTEQGWIYWEKAAELAPAKVEHAYEDKPSYELIDMNLMKGNPVIVRLRYPGGTTHFVVIMGKEGFDYLIRDPGGGGKKGVYPLKEFGSGIEALRFYRTLTS